MGGLYVLRPSSFTVAALSPFSAQKAPNVPFRDAVRKNCNAYNEEGEADRRSTLFIFCQNDSDLGG